MSRYFEEVLASGICPKCREKKPDIEQQYSYGIYAGVMCRACAVSSYRDGCGHTPDGQGNPADLDEPYDGDDQ